MPTEDDPPLRLLVGQGLRLAVRAFCAQQNGALRAPVIHFGVAAPQHPQNDQGPTPDLVLGNGVEMGRALVSPPDSVVRFGSEPVLAASRPEIRLSPATLLDRMLEPRIRLAVAIPGAAVAAEVTERFCRACDAQRPGTGAILRSKTRVVRGADYVAWGPRQVMELLGSGEADIVLGPRLGLRSLSAVADVVMPPPILAMDLHYSLAITALEPARRSAAQRFARLLLSAPGQAILARQGLDPVRLGARLPAVV